MPSSATVRQKRSPARRVCTVMFTGFGLCRTLLFSRFSSSRAISASSTESTVCSAGSSCSSVIPQCSASGLSQNCATSCRNSGPARRSFRRRGWAPYSSLLVRFRSSMRVRSFSHWVRMPAAFCRERSGKSASCSNCSAQPKISASGVRTSWLTPAIHWVRALSRRESISFLACSCAPVWFSFSASSPAKPSVGSWTVCPCARASRPFATVSSRFAPRQLSQKQSARPSSSIPSAAAGSTRTMLRARSGEL